MTEDPSCGYEAAADDYIAARSAAGIDVVKKWADGLPAGSEIIDIASGHGQPITDILITAGHAVWAIDASQSLVAAHQRLYPNVPIVCETAQASTYFGKSFDAAIMIGLIFLLERQTQEVVIKTVADRLKPGGHLLMSAPWQTGGWTDVLTGKPSYSLGRERYGALLQSQGLAVFSFLEDEAGTHYYLAEKLRSGDGSRF